MQQSKLLKYVYAKCLNFLCFTFYLPAQFNGAYKDFLQRSLGYLWFKTFFLPFGPLGPSRLYFWSSCHFEFLINFLKKWETIQERASWLRILIGWRSFYSIFFLKKIWENYFEWYSLLRFLFQIFLVEKIFTDGIFGTLYTTWGDEQLKKISFCQLEFLVWFWRTRYRETSWQVYHQNLSEHSKGPYESTQLVFWNFKSFCDVRVPYENFRPFKKDCVRVFA